MSYKTGDVLLVGFEGTHSNFPDFIRSAFLNVQIVSATVLSYHPMTVQVTLATPGVHRIEGLIASWGGRIIDDEKPN